MQFRKPLLILSFAVLVGLAFFSIFPAFNNTYAVGSVNKIQQSGNNLFPPNFDGARTVTQFGGIWFYIHSDNAFSLDATLVSQTTACFPFVNGVCSNSNFFQLVNSTSWTHNAYALTDFFGTSFWIVYTTGVNTLGVIDATFNGVLGITHTAPFTCTLAHTNFNKVSAFVDGNGKIWIAAEEQQAGTNYVELFKITAGVSSCVSQGSINNAGVPLAGLVVGNYVSNSPTYIVEVPSTSTTGALEVFSTGIVLLFLSADTTYANGAASCSFDGQFAATTGDIRCLAYDGSHSEFNLESFSSTIPVSFTESLNLISASAVNDMSFGTGFTGANSFYTVEFGVGNTLYSDYSIDGSTFTAISQDFVQSGNFSTVGASCSSRSVTTLVPFNSCVWWVQNGISYYVYNDIISPAFVILHATTTTTNVIVTTTVSTSNTTVTLFNSPNPTTAAYWLIPLIFMILPMAMFDGIMFGIASQGSFQITGSVFLTFTNLGLLLGTIFGLLAGVIPLGLVILVGFVFAIVLWLGTD